MTTARRLSPLRSLAACCALGGSVLLMAGCGKTETTRSSVAAAAPTSAAATSAASATTAASPSPASPSASLNEDKRRALISNAKVSWDMAAGTAVKEVSGSRLVALALKATPPGATAMPDMSSHSTPSAGAPEWVARVAAADGTVHRVDIDAVAGKVFRSEVERGQDAEDRREAANRLSTATQTPAQAVRTATAKTRGTVIGVDLEDGDRRLVWSVDIVTTDDWKRTGYEVDARSGAILREHSGRR